MKSDLKKIAVADIDEQWIKGTKDMLMGYSNKYFVELMAWIYARYGQITLWGPDKKPGYDASSVSRGRPHRNYFNQIETFQEFAIAGNFPFSDRQLAGMVLYQIMAIQEYTHAYRMWKIIAANECTWVWFKARFKYA